MPRVAPALAALALLTAPAVADDWPQWRGRNRDGKSPETGLSKNWGADGPKLLWSVTDPKVFGVGYGTPSVVGERVYLLGSADPKQTAAEALTCLNAKTGKVVWSKPLGTTPGQFNDGWGGGTRSAPTVSGGFIYCLGATGDLVCFDEKDGRFVWRKNMVKDYGGKIPVWGYSESPLVDGDTVVVTPGNKGGVVALNRKTGKTVWQCKEVTDDAGYSSLVPTEVGGVRQYVQQNMGTAFGVRASDGKLLWKAGEIGRRVAVIPTPVVKDSVAFFTSGYGAGCESLKLEPDGKGTKAETLFTKNKVVSNHHGGVIEHNGRVYGHSDSSGWFCFDYKAGPEEAEWANKKFPKGSVLYADGSLFCYSENDGKLVRVAASPEGWKEEGDFQIPKTSKLRPSNGKVWAHPVIANGKLFLRDYENLFCYDLGGKTVATR